MSWLQLEDIVRINRAQIKFETEKPPTVCPIEGEPLDVRGDGVRNCPFGNFRWQGGHGTFI